MNVLADADEIGRLQKASKLADELCSLLSDVVDGYDDGAVGCLKRVLAERALGLRCLEAVEDYTCGRGGPKLHQDAETRLKKCIIDWQETRR